MRISDVMTRDVESLSPETTLREAAERMRELDTGAMPVSSGGVPIGIVTDRDIVIRAAADGRDPSSCTVQQVMTQQTVTMHVDESVADAAAMMKSRQVRRVMVVDDSGRLCGIVSLGDLSLRTHDDALAEDTLEGVSSPGRPRESDRVMFEREPTRRIRPGAMGAMGAMRGYAPEPAAGAGVLLGLTAGLLIGAGLAFVFDPDRGRTRRALARDQFYRRAHEAREHARKRAQRARNQARGITAEARRAFTADEADDRVLRERVRAAMGRIVSHPHAIGVDTFDGVVTLSGPILRHEVPELMTTVVNVRGVRDVINALEPHETGQGVPALQGGGRA